MLIRPLGTALAAVAFAASLSSVASASDMLAPPRPVTAAALATDASIRADLEAIETATATSQPDADLKMWSAPHTTAHGPLFAGGKRSDAMHRFARGIVSRTSSLAISLTRDAMRYIGTPYVFGGTSPAGFDCSGYVQHVFAMLGIALPRTADAQFYAGRSTRGQMKAGDLVFFQTYEPGPSHVGIYLGHGHFVHSSSHGVMVSRISEGYWASRYLGAKRVSQRLASR